MLVLFLFYHIITSFTLSLRYVSVSQWLKDKLGVHMVLVGWFVLCSQVKKWPDCGI